MKLFLPLLFWFTLTQSRVQWLGPTSYDFGDLKKGVPVQHEFRFRNAGAEPLVLEVVRTSCGCTALDWEDTVVPPDSTGSIRVEYDAKRSGWFRKKITVFFEGQRKPERLYIQGYVEDD